MKPNEHLEVENEYIDLTEVVAALLRHAFLILFVGIIFGAAVFGYTNFIERPFFDASAMMIVNPGERDVVTQDQINSATKLVETYSVIIRSDTVMDEVKSRLHLEDSFADEVKSISVESVNNTQVMEITVRASSAELARDVCETITDVAPEIIVRAVKAGSMELVSKASTTGVRSYPNVKKMTAIGAFLGLFVAAGIITLVTIMDNKVKSEKDIRQGGLTVLGVIPSFEREGR